MGGGGGGAGGAIWIRVGNGVVPSVVVQVNAVSVLEREHSLKQSCCVRVVTRTSVEMFVLLPCAS